MLVSPELFLHESERVEYKTRTCTSNSIFDFTTLVQMGLGSLWLWTSVVQSVDHRKLMMFCKHEAHGHFFMLYCV